MRTEDISIEVADGVSLDGEIVWPEGPVVGGLVFAHPHPLFGGNQLHPIVQTVTGDAAKVGWVALRFDFRGTGRSTGSHGKGIDEVLDIQAACTTLLEKLAEQVGISGASDPKHVPLVIGGYSFGGVMALRAEHPSVTHRLGVAAPVSAMPVSVGPKEPTLLLVPAHDQYTDVDAARSATTSWTNELTIDKIESADHFLNGFVGEVSRRTMAWLTAIVEPSS